MIDILKSARRVSTPLLFIRTSDPAATQLQIGKEYESAPLVMYDSVSGVRGLNGPGRQAVQLMCGKDVKPEDLTSPVEMLNAAAKLPGAVPGKPDGTILFVHNLQMFLTQDQAGALAVQGLQNLRDVLKVDRRTLIGLGPYITLPPELKQDVVVIDEPLPTDEQLASIVKTLHEAANLPAPDRKAMGKAVDALRGLTTFSAEQVTAMSLTKNGLAMESLWERVRKMIEATQGLSIWRGKERLNQIYGLDNLIGYAKPLLKHVSVVLFLDELEKMFAGANGDNTGVSQALHRYLLTYMSDREILAMLLVGPPGTGKSMFAKAVGNEADVPTIALDINGLTNSLVGRSEENCRAAFQIIDAVGRGRVMLIATCNSIEQLSPELRSRFLDTFFVELPNEQARTAMWQAYGKEFGVADQEIPNDEGWTGREIRNCCRKANLRGVDLKEASQFVTPISVSASEQIASLRERSAGRFLDASKPGLYYYEPKAAKVMRAISLPLVGNN